MKLRDQGSLAEALRSLRHENSEAQNQTTKAFRQVADNAARFTAAVIEAMGLGVMILAEMVVFEPDDRLVDRLIQIAELVKGKPSDFLRGTLFDYGKDGMAVIFLIKTDDGLDLKIVVSKEESDLVVAAAKTRAETLGRALGVCVPVFRASETDPL